MHMTVCSLAWDSASRVYSHIRMEAKRKAVEALDNDRITSQLDESQRGAEQTEAPQAARKRRKLWSGRADLNRGPPAPKAGALPGCATPRLRGDPFRL